MPDQPIQPGDLVRIKRRKRSVMIRVERFDQRASGWINLSGPRVRQSDHALLSGRNELRYGYYLAHPEDIQIVKQTCAWCGGEVNDENRVVHAGRFNARLYMFNHPSCLAAFVRDTTADHS